MKNNAELLLLSIIAFVLAALVIVLRFTSATLFTVLAYTSIVSVVLFVYYKYMIRTEFLLSLSFPVFIILMIQIVVYPIYIFFTDNSRSYLFTDISTHLPEYAPAIFLWLLAVIGFSWGLAIRLRERTGQGPKGSNEQIIFEVASINLKANLIAVTLPLMILSLTASYVKFRSYGYSSLAHIADLGSFSADSIRRNRGLGPLTLMEMWSYVAVAYVGWHAFSTRRFRFGKLVLGIVYALFGSLLSLLNARRGVIFVHIGLLVLPFMLSLFSRRKVLLFLVPFLLVSMFFLDRVTSEIRTVYYQTSRLDLTAAIRAINGQRYAPLSYNHLELSAALLEQIESDRFEPMMGETFLGAILNWLPRSLFPNKPWTGGPYLAIAMGGAYSFNDSRYSSSMTTGLIIENLMNFGSAAFLVVPLLMAFLGYVLSAIDIYSFFKRNSSVYFAAFSIYYWSVTGLFADDMGGVVTKFVMNTSGLVLLYILTRVAQGIRGQLKRPLSYKDVVCDSALL